MLVLQIAVNYRIGSLEIEFLTQRLGTYVNYRIGSLEVARIQVGRGLLVNYHIRY